MVDIFTIDVGFTTTRPIVPDQHIHRVIVRASSETEAKLAAAQMVGGIMIGGGLPEMTTSTKIISVEI